MSKILRMSEIYAPTLKEDPADAEIASHKLLLRAGMIRKTASGLYTFLPLGMRVLNKVKRIISEEMNAIGAQEILMPVVQPAELWHESGRWNDYGPELMRLKDRHDRDFCLGPTHEELIMSVVRNELRSYKDLPVTLYQIQVKFRDEIRPRFGLLRSREFIMKDAYSFHTTQASLQQTYDEMSGAYGRICGRLGLEWRAVDADSGQIGGSVSREFMALADAGEAELVYCECGYAANAEAGEGLANPTEYSSYDSLTKIETPGVHTIEALATFLRIDESATVKAMVGKDAKGRTVALFLPGDHELNELKASKAVPGFELLSDREMEAAGLPKGSIGPVGLPENVRIIAAPSLKAIGYWVVGANEEGYHFVGARPGVDFEVDEWADIIVVKPGDRCPKCGAALEGARGIEVSQIFQLGDKYSRSMGATYSAEDGSEQHFIMGCYGVGVSRSLAAVVEQYSDEDGIAWPASIAPAHVCIIPLEVDDDLVFPAALQIAEKFAGVGIEVVIDDRDERAGVKFNDADLIGWPVQVILGKRGMKESKIEIKHRQSGRKKDFSLDSVTEMIAYAKRNFGSDGINFKGLFS